MALDDDVRIEVLRGFVDRGRPPVPPELAERLGTSVADVEAALRRLHDGHVLVLAPGTPYVWMANPFSAVPTPFEVRAGERSWFGNCIWDALGIVALLGGTGEVRTWCPDCREPLAVGVHDGEVADAPEGAVVHFAIPAAEWWADIGST
jgi:hypothetical protein